MVARKENKLTVCLCLVCLCRKCRQEIQHSITELVSALFVALSFDGSAKVADETLVLCDGESCWSSSMLVLIARWSRRRKSMTCLTSVTPRAVRRQVLHAHQREICTVVEEYTRVCLVK